MIPNKLKDMSTLEIAQLADNQEEHRSCHK